MKILEKLKYKGIEIIVDFMDKFDMEHFVEGSFFVNPDEISKMIFFVDDLISKEKEAENKIAILNYSIDLLKNDIKYFNSLKFIKIASKSKYFDKDFYSEKDRGYYPQKVSIPITYYLEDGTKVNLFDSTSKTYEEGFKIDASKECIISAPHDISKLIDNVKKIYTQGFISERNKAQIMHYKYLDIFEVIDDGNHSVSIAQIKDEGSFKVKWSIDTSELFPHIDIVGNSWINTHTKKSISEIKDHRIGLIYKFAKMKWEIENK